MLDEQATSDGHVIGHTSPLRVLIAGRVCPMRWTTKPLKSRAVTALYYKMTNEGLYLDKFMFF